MSKYETVIDIIAERDSLRARVAELEAKLAMAITVGDETADLRKAAEQRAEGIERERIRLEKLNSQMMNDLDRMRDALDETCHMQVRAVHERDALRTRVAESESRASAAEQRVKRLKEALCEAERWIVEHDGEAEDCECSYCSMLTRIRAVSKDEAPAREGRR